MMFAYNSNDESKHNDIKRENCSSVIQKSINNNDRNENNINCNNSVTVVLCEALIFSEAFLRSQEASFLHNSKMGLRRIDFNPVFKNFIVIAVIICQYCE